MKTSGDQWRDKWRYPLLSRLNNDDFKIMNFQTLRSIKRPPGVSIETVVEALEPPGKSRLSIETVDRDRLSKLTVLSVLVLIYWKTKANECILFFNCLEHATSGTLSPVRLPSSWLDGQLVVGELSLRATVSSTVFNVVSLQCRAYKVYKVPYCSLIV